MTTPASIQERLQPKRIPLDKWSVKEQLCLASAVQHSGNQNWSSISHSLKVVCDGNRPADWFTQKSCAAQYDQLLENVETPRRMKRSASERDSSALMETPGERIVRDLTHERIVELRKSMLEEKQQFQKLKEEIRLVQNDLVDEETLREMWTQIEAERKVKEREEIQYAQWLWERDRRKLEMERALLPNKPALTVKQESDEDMEIDGGASPLLLSLLKSSQDSHQPMEMDVFVEAIPSGGDTMIKDQQEAAKGVQDEKEAVVSLELKDDFKPPDGKRKKDETEEIPVEVPV